MEYFLLNYDDKKCSPLRLFSLRPYFTPPPLPKPAFNGETYLQPQKSIPGVFHWTSPTKPVGEFFRVIDTSFHYHDCTGYTLAKNVLAGTVSASQPIEQAEHAMVQEMIDKARSGIS